MFKHHHDRDHQRTANKRDRFPSNAPKGKDAVANQEIDRRDRVHQLAEVQKMANESPRHAAAREFNDMAQPLSVPPIQRKVNDLTPPGNDLAFANGGTWQAFRDDIVAYNQIPVNDKVYTHHAATLDRIKEEGDASVTDAKLTESTEKDRLEREGGELNERINRLEEELRLSDEAHRSLDELKQHYERRLASNLERFEKAGVEADGEYSNYLEGEKLKLELNIREQRALITANREGNRTVADRLESLRSEKVDNDLSLLQPSLRLLSLNVFSWSFDREVSPEKAAVLNQIANPQNARDAEFAPIDETGKGRIFEGRPAKLNKLATAFAAENDASKKFDLLLQMQEFIASWRKDYVDPGTGDIKANITGDKREDRILKFAGIKMMEQQLVHSRKALYQQIFANLNPPAAAASDKEGRTTALETAKTVLKEGGGDTGSWAKALKQVGAPTIWGLEKEKGGQVYGEGLVNASNPVKDGLGLGSSGADGIIQILQIIKIGKEWGSKKGLDKFSAFLDIATGVAKVTKDVASVSDTIDTMVVGDERRDVSKVPDKDWLGKAAVWTSGLADSIGTVKSTAQAIISIYRATQRAGVDNEKALNYGIQGGISIAEAAKSSISAISSFMKIADATVPPALQFSIPILGLAIGVGNVILSIAKAAQAGTAEKDMTEMGAPFQAAQGANPLSGLSLQTGISVQHLGLITREEKRGVLGFGGGLGGGLGKTYRRFNPYVLEKIDAHLSGPQAANNLTIDLDQGGTVLTLTPAQVKSVREYEYISKMQEINQKRKVKGGIDTVLTLVSMGGDIAVLSGAGALVGATIKSLVAVEKVGHFGAKAGQKMYRNRERNKLDERIAQDGSAAPSNTVRELPNLAKYNELTDNEVDKSSKQKETEYRRHARYVLDRIQLVPVPANPDDTGQIANAQREIGIVKKLLHATGVDYFDFINKPDIDGKFKLLVSAQKGGR